MSLPEGLDLRQELPLLRELYRAALETPGEGEAVLAEVAARDPVALVELVMGPRAPGGARAVAAALGQAAALEAAVSPKAVYGRLAELAGEEAITVLRAAARTHPVAVWLVDLALKRGGEAGALAVLEEVANRPQLAAACQLQAEGEQRGALIAFALQTGSPVPAAALLHAGHLDEFGLAAIRAAERVGLEEVLPVLSAAWGPDLEGMLLRMVSHLREPELAEDFAGWCRAWSPDAGLLQGIAAGVARGG